MSKHYFTVVTQDEKGGTWAVDFGDYDRAVANEEAQLLKDAGQVYAVKVIKTAPEQEAITAAVAALNA